jgi:shikimate dehydrogenase
MYRAALRELGLVHTYDVATIPDLVRLEAMVDAVRQGVIAGANIGVPYKQHALKMVDRIDATAAELGCADTLVREGKEVAAYNTEALALADDLRALQAEGRTAAVIGSRTGALAAVSACARIGAKVVAVTSRSWLSSEHLVSSDTAEEFRRLGALPCAWPGVPTGDRSSKLSDALRLQWPDIAAGSSVVIQATSAGMKDADPGSIVTEIMPWGRMKKGALLYDLVYNPPDTPFLKAARERGLSAAGGLGMLVRQGAHSLSLWLKVNAKIDLMRQAAEQAMLGGSR